LKGFDNAAAPTRGPLLALAANHRAAFGENLKESKRVSRDPTWPFLSALKKARPDCPRQPPSVMIWTVFIWPTTPMDIGAAPWCAASLPWIESFGRGAIPIPARLPRNWR